MEPIESFYNEKDDNQKGTSVEEQSTSVIPAPLFSKIFGAMAAGSILIIIFIVCGIAFRKTMQPVIFLSGALFGAYLLIMGLNIKRKWKNGRIEERIYRCVSCKKVIPISVTAITRRAERKYNSFYEIVCTETEETENQHLYEFRIGRDGAQLSVGGLVILYIDTQMPRNPVAWKIL